MSIKSQSNDPRDVRLTITQLENLGEDRIFVINEFVSNDGKMGDILIPMSHSEGQGLAIRIPMTWIPVEVTQQIPKEPLLKNVIFRQQLQRRHIRAIPVEVAEAILEDERAQDELARIETNRQQVTALAMSDNDAVLLDEPKLKEGAKGEYDPAYQGINPVIVELFKRTDVSDSERYSAVRTTLATLKLADLNFIAKNSDDPMTLKLVKAAIEKIKN
jgi:hypothetical protein